MYLKPALFFLSFIFLSFSTMVYDWTYASISPPETVNIVTVTIGIIALWNDRPTTPPTHELYPLSYNLTSGNSVPNSLLPYIN